MCGHVNLCLVFAHAIFGGEKGGSPIQIYCPCILSRCVCVYTVHYPGIQCQNTLEPKYIYNILIKKTEHYPKCN